MTEEDRDAILLAFEAGRRAGLEEAAKQAARFTAELAQAIRALKG
jgi:hypothetical protein